MTMVFLVIAITFILSATLWILCDNPKWFWKNYNFNQKYAVSNAVDEEILNIINLYKMGVISIERENRDRIEFSDRTAININTTSDIFGTFYRSNTGIDTEDGRPTYKTALVLKDFINSDKIQNIIIK